MLSLMSNELLGPAKPNTNGAAQQLSEALQLSRLSLFDLDVWVMGHALTARRRVLSSMWHNAQTRAVLALSHEALKSHLKEGISKSAGGRCLCCFAASTAAAAAVGVITDNV
jgi:hypothetical protein